MNGVGVSGSGGGGELLLFPSFEKSADHIAELLPDVFRRLDAGLCGIAHGVLCVGVLCVIILSTFGARDILRGGARRALLVRGADLFEPHELRLVRLRRVALCREPVVSQLLFGEQRADVIQYMVMNENVCVLAYLNSILIYT